MLAIILAITRCIGMISPMRFDFGSNQWCMVVKLHNTDRTSNTYYETPINYQYFSDY